MREPVGYSVIGRAAAAVAALWFCGAGAAWAGGAGESVGPLQKVLDNTCTMVGILSCPQLPTTNQLIVEIAALTGATPSEVRADALPGTRPINPLGAVDGGTRGGVVQPLAFISAANKLTPPIPTQPNNPAANSFISASLSGGTMNFSFDYLPRTNPVFAAGQDVGDIALPFEVADAHGKPVRDVSGVLQIRGTGGTAVTTSVVGDFLGSTRDFSLADLGMTFSLEVSSAKGAVFDVGAPLLIDANLAPGYDFSAPGFELAPGLFEGIDPVATFLTANFVNNANDPRAVNADLAAGGNSDTVLSSPGLPEPSSLALLASGFAWLGLASLRRRRRARA